MMVCGEKLLSGFQYSLQRKYCACCQMLVIAGIFLWLDGLPMGDTHLSLLQCVDHRKKVEGKLAFNLFLIESAI